MSSTSTRITSIKTKILLPSVPLLPLYLSTRKTYLVGLSLIRTATGVRAVLLATIMKKITEYLNSHHAGVTSSKRAVHDKTKEIVKAYNKPTSSRAPQIYSNTRPRPTSVGQGYRPTMSAMHNNPSISMHNFNDLAQHYDDFVLTDGIGRENELHERLERISGLNLLDSALHSDCVVTSSLILQDGSSIECRTLADTGCAQQCFMSEGHFLKYPILQQYLVKHPTNTIDLATHGSTAVVSKYISVVLEIVHRGKPIRCKIVIGIMKGLRYDLVLSLVVIASHYVDVLVDLLNVQLNRPTSISVNSISMMISQDAQQAAQSSPIQCAHSPLALLEGEDSASVERSYSEILFHDPLNPQGSPDSSTADIDIDDSPTTSSIAASPQRTCEDMSN